MPFKNLEVVDFSLKQENEFPSEPKERFESVFSAIGNSEVKCLALLLLGDIPNGGRPIWRKYLNLVGKAERIAPSTLTSYYDISLSRIGLIAEADILYGGWKDYTIGYRATDAGQKYGHPIAAHLLERSSTLPNSLGKIFGQTSIGSGDSRAVLNRVSILEFLAEAKGSVRSIDLATEIGLAGAGVGTHMRHFNELGFATYSSVNVEDGTGVVTYTVSHNPPDQILPIEHNRALTPKIIAILQEKQSATSGDIAAVLRKDFQNTSVENLKARIAMVLSGLRSQGFCYADYRGRELYSKAQITEAGRYLVTTVIEPIKRALSDQDDLLADWKKIDWTKYIPEVVAKYRAESGHVNWELGIIGMERIVSLLTSNPGMRPKEIRELLGRSPTPLLKTLEIEGRIHKKKIGKATHYFITE